jgi:two-component system cell cycle sensor histidine kinase PleC
MPVAALLVGGNGEVLEANARADRLLGLQRQAGAVRFIHRLVDAAHYQQRVRPAFHEARAQGASMVGEVRFLGVGQHAFSGELHIAWLPGADAGTEADGPYVCALVDRSEHIAQLQALQASQEALRHSQAQLAETARLARMGGWELRLQPRQWRLSAELRQLLELPDDDAGAPPTLLAHCQPAQHGVLQAALEAAEHGTPFELELDFSSLGGRAMRVLVTGRALPALAGLTPTDEPAGAAVQRISGVLQDITDTAMARRQISELTDRLRVANAAGGIGVWDWDPQAGTVLLDARMGQLLGLQAPVQLPLRTLRRQLATMLPRPQARCLNTALRRLLHAQQPFSLELQRHSSDGVHEDWLHVSARVAPAGTGEGLRVVGAAWDCSSEHEAARLLAAKQAAESANRSKSAFLSRMSHELRTPLNAILGFSQLMRMQADAGDLVLRPHRVTLIETAARHLLELVNEVLDVSRIESGQLQLQTTRVDLHDVVRECLPLVQALADRGGVSLHAAPSSGAPCWVLGDRLRLKEVLINLLSNAAKYNRRGGSVQVAWTTLPQVGLIELSVSDTGPGMTAEQMQGLFQPFNRLGAEASDIEGSGMGLFVSRRFVELMGGEITVRSTPGEGSCFTVRLRAPVGEAAGADAVAAANGAGEPASGAAGTATGASHAGASAWATEGTPAHRLPQQPSPGT